ncbi:MAG: superoxide dismutase [Cu-Zn] SodC [Iodobacter sp.]
MKKSTMLICALLPLFGQAVAAESIRVQVNLINETGIVAPAGNVIISESPYGLIFTPALSNLTPGMHGFHLHQNPSCNSIEQKGVMVAGLAAGGHWDPENTKMHRGPYADGHLGDLPSLFVTGEGQAQMPVLAPRIKSLNAVRGHSLMIHVNGDNHSDHPAPLGGGGPRLACGVIDAMMSQ